MKDNPKTEVSVAEIMGAITLRVAWAAVKRFVGLALFYLIFFGIVLFLQSYFEWENEWNPIWGVPLFTLWLWMFLYEATKRRSFHREQWYFPKTNVFTSLISSAYVVVSVWSLISFEKGLTWLILFYILCGVPAFIYYILNCGYYLVMLKRYPSYEHEDFAIPMPSVLFDLSLKKGGISGADKGAEDTDYDY
ncbi:MAG: hypothetical protein O9283_10985 [Sphingomonadaceae bacterium]|jgi:hypothetical protein|nr:hypothetical protein [Sphingomonadaceae bacterium]